MDTFGLKIIASDKVFYEGRCRKLIIPAPDGEKGILANHENMVIGPGGGLRIRRDRQQPCDASGGYGGAAGGYRRAPRQGAAGARRGADAPEAEHPGVLPHPGVAGPGHEPSEGGAGQEVERTLGEYSTTIVKKRKRMSFFIDILFFFAFIRNVDIISVNRYNQSKQKEMKSYKALL